MVSNRYQLTIVAGALILSLLLKLIVGTINNYIESIVMFNVAILLGNTVLAFYNWVIPRMAYAIRRVRQTGADSVSHLLYYIHAVCVLFTSNYCTSLEAIANLVLLSYMATCIGTMGLLLETYGFSIQPSCRRRAVNDAK